MPAAALAIEGQVIDASGKPVAQAMVTLQPAELALGASTYTVFTDADGRYTLPAKAAGTQPVGAQARLRAGHAGPDPGGENHPDQVRQHGRQCAAVGLAAAHRCRRPGARQHHPAMHQLPPVPVAEGASLLGNAGRQVRGGKAGRLEGHHQLHARQVRADRPGPEPVRPGQDGPQGCFRPHAGLVRCARRGADFGLPGQTSADPFRSTEKL